MTTAGASNRRRVAVLGAGPGGYAAAFHAAELGFDVTLIGSDDQPGGVCLYVGCIPSKALLHVARVIRETEEAEDFGVRFAGREIDLDALREWKDGVVRRLTGGLGLIARQRRVRYVRGHGSFANANTLRLRNDGELFDVEFDHAVIATGSQPVVPESLRLDSPLVMDSTDALALPDIPESLLVVGGGYIGLELGGVYAALGSRVTVVEMTGGLLPGADRDLVEPLAKRLATQFEAIHLNTRVTGLEEADGGIKARLSGTVLGVEERLFSRALVAVGRRPNTRDLGLERLGVKLDARGFIATDRQRRTTEPAIFAIGDVAGEPMLAHKATHEARVAADAIAGARAAFDAAAIPAVIFTDPEIAWCGLTETQARERGIEVVVSKFPWGASGRAVTLGRTEGLTKLVLEPGTERVLGVGIVGVSAGELIGEATLAVEMGARATDLALTIHAHPTLAETLMEAAETLYGRSPHYVTRRR